MEGRADERDGIGCGEGSAEWIGKMMGREGEEKARD